MDSYEDAVVNKHCAAFVDANAWKLFQKEEYYKNLTRARLIYIWQIDTRMEGPNKLPEISIYEEAIEWAKAESERQGRLADGPKNQREMLGDALNLICFPRMTLKEFCGIARRVTVSMDEFFTAEEMADMIVYMVNMDEARLPFGGPLQPKSLAAEPVDEGAEVLPAATP
ncbi:hypothetical protein RvY_11155 [Ramazzottius varieornatus]|uniref:BACK domain-containing protein n=1 Tax=Ramazzottius varieornatus TaxID=947166 RepID=A0A1D1VH83_RAMVA|nr:hypothetical protein RvY_11155 [Ramazzottius varieornatus]